MTTVTADENHNDISNEYSEGPREQPDHGIQREELRTSFKDAQPSDFKNQQFKLHFSPFLFSGSSALQFPQRTDTQVIQAIRCTRQT